MADDFESDTGVGFKRSISDTQVPLSPRRESPRIGSDTDEGAVTVLHGSDFDLESFNCLQKKAKRSSDQENQGIEEVKLDHKCDDDAMKVNDDNVGFSNSLVHSPVVGENNNDLSGIQESATGEINKSSCQGLAIEQVQMDSAVEGVAESISDFRSHVVNFTGERLVVTKGKHNDGNNKARNGNQSGRGEDVKCALKIQVIDDTALIGSLYASKVGNHMERKGIKKNMNQEIFGNENKSRRRGKNLKKCLGTNGNEKIVVLPQKKADVKEEKKKWVYARKEMDAMRFSNVEEQSKKWIANVEGEEEKKKWVYARKEMDGLRFSNVEEESKEWIANVEEEEEKKEKWAYTRKEMEALRFANVEEQKKKWTEIYCGFGPSVTKEYDGLVDCNNHQKHIQVNFDPRPLLRRKDAAPPILSGEYCENTANETQSMNCLDPVCDSVVQEELIEGEEDDDHQSDDEDYSSMQRPAFLVMGEPDFDSGPPQDGLEYRRRVRWEAEHIPKVTVAKVERSKLNQEQTIYVPTIPDIASCPDRLLPQKQWEDEFLGDFSKLRLALSHHECASSTANDHVSIQQDCSSLILDSNVLENFDHLTSSGVDSSPKSLIDECAPTLSIIRGMDDMAQVSMLRKRICSFETMSCLSRNDCVWLFALCAAVDTPLNADMCASLRCLLRKCASLRSQKTEMDDELVMLNIVATISGKYFGQSEN